MDLYRYRAKFFLCVLQGSAFSLYRDLRSPLRAHQYDLRLCAVVRSGAHNPVKTFSLIFLYSRWGVYACKVRAFSNSEFSRAFGKPLAAEGIQNRPLSIRSYF